jgi:hypothetical protein
MEGLTQKILHASVSPLGTMSASSVDDALLASQYWMSVRSGYAIDSADRLLQRLMYERASGAIAAQKRTKAIADLQRQILQSWLSLGSFRSAIERAEAILACMVAWHERGLSAHLPFPEMIALVKVCVYEANYPANAAKQLLQWTENPDTETATKLVPLFNATLKLCVQEEDRTTAISLYERMEKLEKEHEWRNLVFDADARKLILDASLMATEAKADSQDDDDSSSRFTPLELKLIHERFIEFLQSALKNDRPKALEIAKQMDALNQSDLTHDVFKALAQYFVRIKDQKQATHLLQRLDIGNASEPSKEPVSPDLFLDILELWAKSQDSDAPWRAQEVVTRMEELENLELLNVTTRSYNLLCEAWVSSDELIATQKVEGILSRMLSAKKKGDTSKAPDRETYKLYLRLRPTDFNLSTRAVSEIMEHGDELGEDLSQVLESTFEALAAHGEHGASSKVLHGKGHAASKLLRQAVERGMVVAPSMCIHALEVYRVSRQPSAVIRELEFLEAIPDMVLPLACYEIAIRTLLDAPGLPYEREEALVAKTLELYSTGKLTAEGHEMETLMKRVMQELEYQGRAIAVEGMLKTLERLVLSNEAAVKDIGVPLECFNNAIKCWADEHCVEKTTEILERLLSYYKAGHESLLPNTSSFFMLIKCQSTEGSSNDMAVKAEAILEKMCKLYESTGNDVCKPDAHCFNAALLAWKKVGTLEAIERSTSLLDKMLSLGIEPEIFTFNTVMQIVAYAPDDVAHIKFGHISRVMKLMQEAGLEPNRFSYFFMLRSCANVTKEEERDSAMNKAMDSMGRLRQSREADLGSYRVFAKAIRQLLRREKDPKRRDKIAAWACLQCYEDGFLDERNEELFRDSMSPQAWGLVSKSFKRPVNEKGISEQARNSEMMRQ